MWRQGAVSIDLCLTPGSVGGQTPKESEHPRAPVHAFPAFPTSPLAAEGQESREVKSMEGLGSPPSSATY